MALTADWPLPRERRTAGRPPVQKFDLALREAEPIRAAADLAPAAQVFTALGNIVRLRIVQLLSDRGPMTAAELRVALSVGDINNHLRVLINAGMLERAGHRKGSGAPVVFALVDDVLDAIASLLR